MITHARSCGLCQHSGQLGSHRLQDISAANACRLQDEDEDVLLVDESSQEDTAAEGTTATPANGHVVP